MMNELVVPAILEKWPAGEMADPANRIIIQQGGAGGHCKATDPVLVDNIKRLEELGMLPPNKICWDTQSSNSPDLNICDLGLFNAIQSYYWQFSPTNSIEIIECVQRAYEEYPWNKINRMFVTLMCVFDCIIRCHGDNTYKLPHMNKARMEEEGTLPQYLKVSAEALAIVRAYG